MARLAERLLLWLSRDPTAPDYPAGSPLRPGQHSLDLLCRIFPDFLERITGKRVPDFGCGDGHQSVTLAQSGAQVVLGFDTNSKTLARARNLAADLVPNANIEFVEWLEPRFQNAFDVVISQNSFEHFNDPARALEEMKWTLARKRAIFYHFGTAVARPLWESYALLHQCSLGHHSILRAYGHECPQALPQRRRNAIPGCGVRIE